MTATTTPVIAERMQTVADLLARLDPTLPAPCVFAYSNGTVEVTWQILRDAPETQLPTLVAIRRAVGGHWDKNPWDQRFDMRHKVNDWLTLEVYAQRDVVCTRRITGTETVTIPAVEAQPERTEERLLVEWDCAPILDEAPEAVSA